MMIDGHLEHQLRELGLGKTLDTSEVAVLVFDDGSWSDAVIAEPLGFGKFKALFKDLDTYHAGRVAVSVRMQCNRYGFTVEYQIEPRSTLALASLQVDFDLTVHVIGNKKSEQSRSPYR